MAGPMSTNQVIINSLLVERVQNGKNNQAGIARHQAAVLSEKKREERKMTVLESEESEKVSIHRDLERDKDKKKKKKNRDESGDNEENPPIKHIDLRA